MKKIAPPLRPLLAATTIVVAAVGLTACVVAPVGPYYGEPVVAVAPPSPPAEYVGAPPVVGYVWIGGFWNWVGGRHVWVQGRWDAPRPGHYWVPHRWEQAPGGWRARPGHWERR